MNSNKSISPGDMELSILVKFFLRNNSYKKCKRMLWKQYTAWVHFSGDGVSAKDHADMLFFYERIKEFLKEANELYKKVN